MAFEFAAAWLRTTPKSERGASLVEYALLVALLAIVCIAAVNLLGKTTSSEFSQINSGITQ